MRTSFYLLATLLLAIGITTGCGEHVPDQGPQGEAAPMEGVEHAEMGGDAAPLAEEAPAEEAPAE
ncbi:MAG: hypothetical protein H6821_13955 [Planctomycetaceae bacterium]|nr:hypothetical protein [Planctomycetales bacterium]MCB9875274.1 hypothetical protein [Planctomycetaceae bacterium]MCB9938942.1 hypothetical protein [Planctomycetaceae bacterium]HRX79324.1 hypothetical protein [Pirellulaceae bacterium]